MTDPLSRAVSQTIAQHSDVVERWLANQPGAWGMLAGQGVLTYRELLGRKLDESERRQVWAALWAALQELRETRSRTSQ